MRSATVELPGLLSFHSAEMYYAREARAVILSRVADASGAGIIGAKIKVISLGAGAEIFSGAGAITIFFTRPF